jgi:hypothetical protein
VRTRTKTLSVGPTLAAELLHEVLTTQYEDEDSPNTAPGPEVGETGTNRTGFDDIDDFHGWSSPSAVRADGTPIPMGAGWSRQVTVEFIDPQTMTMTTNDTGLKQVTVVVQSPAGGTVQTQALRSNIGASERPPHADRTIISGASVSVSLEPGAAKFRRTFIKNYGTDD